MIPVRWFRLLLPVWTLVLIVGSFLPAKHKNVLGTQSLNPVHNARPGLQHRAWHIASFGSTALIASLGEPNRRKRYFMWPLLAFGLGVAIECLQPVLFGSAFEWWDIRDDGFGVALFAILGEVAAVRGLLVRAEHLTNA